MLILAIDTSGETCSVAVADGEKCRAEYVFRHERRLIERLPGAVQFVLSDAGITITDVEAFAVGLGPGSFTGVRVGVTFAKVWAMATGKSVVGISSLDAMAAQVAFTGLPLACVAPTRKTESVAAFYVGGTATPVAAPAVYSNGIITTTAREITNNIADELLIVGEIAPMIFTASPPETAFSASAVVVAPLASAVARLAFARLSRGESDDTDALVPLYVTPPPTG